MSPLHMNSNPVHNCANRYNICGLVPQGKRTLRMGRCFYFGVPYFVFVLCRAFIFTNFTNNRPRCRSCPIHKYAPQNLLFVNSPEYIIYCTMSMSWRKRDGAAQGGVRIMTNTFDFDEMPGTISTEHRAQSTEHRAQSTEHRAQSTACCLNSFLSFTMPI